MDHNCYKSHCRNISFYIYVGVYDKTGITQNPPKYLSQCEIHYKVDLYSYKEITESEYLAAQVLES